MSKPFYITTPIYYVNASPHIGHAYTTIVADVLARFARMSGRETFFVTGTDEHGDKIAEAARKANITPKQYADGVSAQFRALWPELSVQHDYFIRTTDADHIDTVRSILQKVYDAGDIYFDAYEGYYCVGCERFYTEKELVDGKCPDHQTEPEHRKESNYFFRMSKYQNWLINHIQKNPDFIRPERYKNEVLAFLREPLEDLCISRPKTRLEWGIELPFDAQYVTYVWFDALINYVTACGYLDDRKKFDTFWPEVRHLVGKDIIRFHCVIWPIMLLALGVNPPVSVFAHGWWTVEGEKMSKSKGNVVDPFEMVERYGADPFRYFLLREVPFGLDGDFSESAVVGRINSDLANDLGNLLNRTLQMIDNFFQGSLPASGRRGEREEEIVQRAAAVLAEVDEKIEDFAFDDALKSIWSFISRGNKYIDETMPWKLAKEGKTEELSSVLNTLYDILRLSAMLVAPFIPETAARIWEQLGLDGEPVNMRFDGFSWGDRAPGHTVKKGKVLFPRIDLEEWKKGREAKAQAPAQPASEEPAIVHEELVGIDSFKAVELRVAQILNVEEIPKSKKLYKLTVDLGYEKRTIVSGIKEFFTPDELLHKKIVVVVNLQPAKLCGVESNGMLLAAGDGKKTTLALLTPDKDIPLGSRVS